MINIGIKRTSSHETSHTRMSEICEFQVHYNYIPTSVNSNSKQAYLIIVITHLLVYVPNIAIAT